MSAIKKTKSTKSPAPATKSAKPAAKKAAITATPAPVAPAEVTPEVVTKLVAAVATPIAAPAVPAFAMINAVIDVGFGNGLYIRGEGAGLSWDKGVLMTCLAPNAWHITLNGVLRPVTFKLLINDLNWCAGADYTVNPGGEVTVTPEF